MDRSILLDIKKLLGLSPEDESFDVDIVIFINTVFMQLRQLGVGPKEAFSIAGSDEVWEDFLDGNTNLEAVKSYIYMKVRLLFDSPNGSVLSSYQEMIKELEARLVYEADNKIFD